MSTSASGTYAHALERLEKIGGATAEVLLPRAEAAFAGQHFWAAFDAHARQLDDARLNAWFERWSPIIASQLVRRRRGANDATDQPRSTGGLERFFKPIEAALYRRRYGMKTNSASTACYSSSNWRPTVSPTSAATPRTSVSALK